MAPLSSKSDEEVVEVVRSQDQEKYAELIRRYQAKLKRYVTYLLGDENLAADAVQETFIKAFVNLHGFNTRKKFSSWIYRIAHNEAMNQVRRTQPVQSITEIENMEDGHDLADNLVKKELIRHAHHCLHQMPLQYREPISLYYLEEKSYDEISDILRLPAGTVATRIHRAKKMLRKICHRS